PKVAHDADIKFASLDVFLRDRSAVILVMDETDPFPKLFVSFYKRCLRDPIRGFFFNRLDQYREFEIFWSRDSLTTSDHGEIRNPNAVVMKNLLRCSLMFAQG